MSSPTTGAPSGSLASVNAAGRVPRDLRIDLIRGAALLVIFSDHVRGNPVRKFMPVEWGFADCAEVFLFLSGYVCGIAYARRYAAQGFLACQRRAGWRCLQIYAANTVMQMALPAIAWIWKWYWPDAASSTLSAMTWPPIRHAGDLWQLLTCAREPSNFCVLLLYLFLLLSLPLMLGLLRRSAGAMLALSFGVYLAVQVAPETVALPRPWAGAYYFNPFAWQLPFFTGVALGVTGMQGKAWIPRSIPAVIVAAMGLELAFLAGLYYEPYSLPYVDKATLGPLRLVHFACVLVIGRTILPASANLGQIRPFRPLVLCGQHSLAVYCAGGLLATVGTVLLDTLGTSLALAACINVLGWMSCILVALLCHVMGKRFQVRVESRSFLDTGRRECSNFQTERG